VIAEGEVDVVKILTMLLTRPHMGRACQREYEEARRRQRGWRRYSLWCGRAKELVVSRLLKMRRLLWLRVIGGAALESVHSEGVKDLRWRFGNGLEV
jgi:hypothetical protein